MPARSPTFFSINYDKVLCTSIKPQSIEERSSSKVTLRGSFGDLTNGSGIRGRLLEINILDPSGFQIEEPIDEITGLNGTFISSLSDLSLDSGRYRVIVRPISDEDQNLTSTAYLDVMNDVLTTDEFIRLSGTYIGVITAIIGLIAFLPRIKSYYSLRSQRRNLVTQLESINSMYDVIHSSSISPLHNKQVISEKLREKRDKILRMFETGELTQDHYSMLNNKISEYLEK